MNISPKKRVRSEMDKKHHRVDSLEHDIKSIATHLQHIKIINPSHFPVYHKYLAWCVEILDQIRYNTLSVYKDCDYIELLIDAYKLELLTIDKNTNKNVVHTIKPVSLLKRPTTGYGTFLQTGIIIYLKYINLYQMWYTFEEVNALLTSPKPDISSHAFLAFLAYFTGSSSSTLAHQLYKINLKKARQGLIKAYASPSFNNIIGLLFLSFISGYKSDSATTILYFSSAIRMAQVLGYDKIVEEKLEEDKEKVEYDKEMNVKKKERIVKLWDSLSLVYYIFSTMLPDIKSLNVNFGPVKINVPKSVGDHPDLNKTHMVNGIEMKTIFLNKNFEKIYSEKKVTESFIEIVSHIQKVELNYSRLDRIHEIPHHELQLPKEKFNIVLGNIMGQLMHNPSLYDTMKKIELKEQIQNMKTIQQFYKSNVFRYHLNTFASLVLIYLYYPSVLVIPKPKRFSINEAMVLYKSAQSVAEFFLIMKQNNIQQTYGLNRGAFACVSCDLAINDGFRLNYESPYYTSVMYIVYVYLSFISEEEWLLSQGFGKKLMIEAKAYVLKLLKLLMATCDSKLKSERLDSVNTIKLIKKNLNNYVVNEAFLLSINKLLCRK